MSEINWGLLKQGPSNLDYLKFGLGIGKDFKEERERREANNALAQFAMDPSSQSAFASLAAAGNPDLTFRAMNARRTFEADKRDMEGRNALADYAVAGLGAFQRSAPPVAGPSPGNSTNSGQGPGVRAPTTQQQAPQQQATPNLSMFGEPQSEDDHAFLRAVRADPMAALKMKGTLRDNAVKSIEAERDFYDFAVSRLAGVTDEAGYQAAIEEADKIMRPLGGDVRAHVPPNFPGAEGLRDLRLRALDAKDQISALLEEANVKADNVRADRNTASLIEDRNARRAESRRYHDQQDSTRRRGQDVRRAAAPGQAPRKAARPTATGPDGAKMEWDGKAWVRVN